MAANGLFGQSLWEKWYQSSLLMYNFIFYCFPRIQKDSLEIGPIEGLKKDHMCVFSFFFKIYGLETIYGKSYASTTKCSGQVVLGL